MRMKPADASAQSSLVSCTIWMMVRMPRALVADAQRERIGEFDFARRIGAIAELVLQPLQAQPVDRAVGAKARHEKTSQPAGRLRQHQEGVAHRRGQEPFVTGDRIGLADRRGGRGIGAHVGAALLFGHAHAERHARLFPPRSECRVVAGRYHLWRDFRQQRRRGGERRQRRARHGDWAQVPALDLRGHVVARRARDFRRRRLALPGGLPCRAVQPRGNAHRASARGRPDETRRRRAENPWGRRCRASADSRWRAGARENIVRPAPLPSEGR